MTAPPRKARGSARCGPVRAACVVRALAMVATVMPIQPAAAESRAPRK